MPQGAHVHGFWPRGLGIVEQLLPGVRAALHAAGAGHGDSARDMQWHQFGGLKCRSDVGIQVTLASRPFLEWQVRQRVLALPNVTLRSGTQVRDLLPDEQRQRVRGVRVQCEGIGEESLEADYVVDATGRSGHATRWLAELGYEAPPESAVRIDVSYASRIYERTRDVGSIGSIAVTTPPRGRRGGVAFAIEGGRWVVTLIGFMGEQPPSDDGGFRDYARSLPLPALHEIASREKVLVDTATFPFSIEPAPPL